MPHEAADTVPPRWLSTPRLFAIAAIVAFLSAGQQYIMRGVQGEPIQWPVIILLTVPFWFLWATLAPIVVHIARRVPITRAGLWWRALAHAVLALLLSFLHSALHVGIALMLGPVIGTTPPPGSGPGLTLQLNWVQLTMNLLVYGAIVGATSAADLYVRFQEREQTAASLQAQLAQARFHALRMQLNPHFLFNAMNTIAMLVRQERATEAVETIAGLSDLLRYVLEETRLQEVPLRTELAFVERYLTIERVRFADRLRTAVRGDEDTLDAHVPNLILQPVVENAVRHGIAQRADAGRIDVTARRADGQLVLRVADDGPGLGDRSPDGVGLANTRARLEQLYGSAGGVTLRDADPTGTIVEITIPYHTRPVEATP